MSSTKEKIKNKIKTHVPKDWIAELRITYRIFMETWYGIKRTGLINIFIISTMAAILFLFGALSRTTMSVSDFSKALGNVLKISVYLKNGTDIDSAKDRLSQIQHVVSIDIKTKEEAWAEMKKEMDVAGISNPLPDTIHLQTDKAENISYVFSEAKKFSFVEDLSYSKDIAQRLQIINKVVHIATIIILLVTIGLTMLIINNTIHLVIQSKKDEIEIMRLMGVSNWYIKVPLVMQGAFYGFTGAFLALFPMKGIENGLRNMHQFFQVPQSLPTASIITFAMLILAVGCSAWGSLKSIKKYLQV